MKKATILGVDIPYLSKVEIYQQISAFLESAKFNFITTLNPEIVLHAYKQPSYRQILNSADLAIVDGFGLLIASYVSHIVRKKGIVPARLTGVDLTQYILHLANEQRLRVFCVVREHGKSRLDEVIFAARQITPHAIISGDYLDLRANEQNIAILNARINAFAPQIILVGLGYPRQEQWLAENLAKIPSARVGVGVGGTFDFWTGQARRAPKWLQKLGLEWLWRVFLEPRRLHRIVQAVIIFPLIFIQDLLDFDKKKFSP